jgi:hypothetical protein
MWALQSNPFQYLKLYSECYAPVAERTQFKRGLNSVKHRFNHRAASLVKRNLKELLAAIVLINRLSDDYLRLAFLAIVTVLIFPSRVKRSMSTIAIYRHFRQRAANA